MADISANNKRIAKNTLLLYFRMFFTMLVSLYTSRVVLSALGVEDFGIYNVVGGIVVLFSFINNAMTISTQRFLNFELGRENVGETQRVFAASLNIYLALVLLFVILAETIGLWFLNRYINLSEGRVMAANWVYQATIAATVLNLIRTPYNAAIIAYERMSFYAYTSIIEVVLKLAIVYLLFSFADRLIAYAWLVTVVSLLLLVVYIIFCRRKFEICRHHTFAYDRKRYAALMSFSGWSLFGSVANVGASQGLNILLNVFFGVFVNAAMGVANQVNNAINQFVGNFQVAFNPQIVKSYASGDKDRFISLILNTSKYSYYLLFLVALPCYLCCNDILQIWLEEVPPHAVSFCRLLILFSLIDAIQGPLWVSAQAVGKIRNYQLLMSLLILLNLPVAYVVLKFVPVAEMALIVRVVINVLTALVRVLYLKGLYSFPIKRYFKEVVWLCLAVTALSLVVPYLVYGSTEGLTRLFTVVALCVICSSVSIYLVGLSRSEKVLVGNIVKKYIIRKNG